MNMAIGFLVASILTIVTTAVVLHKGSGAKGTMDPLATGIYTMLIVVGGLVFVISATVMTVLSAAPACQI